MRQSQARGQQPQELEPLQTVLAGSRALRRDDVQRVIAQHDLCADEDILGQDLAAVGASALRTSLQYGQVEVLRIQTKVGQHHAAVARNHLGVLEPEYDIR